jgi:hypothetical protein
MGDKLFLADTEISGRPSVSGVNTPVTTQDLTFPSARQADESCDLIGGNVRRAASSVGLGSAQPARVCERLSDRLTVLSDCIECLPCGCDAGRSGGDGSLRHGCFRRTEALRGTERPLGTCSCSRATSHPCVGMEAWSTDVIRVL